MQQSRRDARIAKSLLRFMRDPSRYLDSVTETIEIGQTELRRHLTLRLKSGVLDKKQEWAYLDILHPDKGSATELRVESGDDSATIASHEDHIAVSTLVILFRLVSVWKTAVIPNAHAAAFDAAMAAAYRELGDLPLLSPADSAALVDRHFDRRSGILRAVLAAPGAVVDALKVNGLFQLCRRLQGRYLVLLKVRMKRGEARSVAFSYPNEVSEYDVRQPGRQRPRPLRRHISSASPPGSFRVHVPWSKRTRHYELKLDAPRDYFFSRQVLLVRQATLVVLPEASPVKWSINTGQGRHSTIFLGDAASESRPIYAGLQSLELPGRSTSRAFTLSLFVTITLAGFAGFALFAFGPVMATASLVVGFLAIGSFIVTPPFGPGVLGYPLLSRFTPSFLAFLSVGFIFWIASREMVATVEIPGGPMQAAAHAIWDGWTVLGGPVIVAAAILISVRMGLRRRALIKNYRRASLETHNVSPNFY